MSRSRLLLVAAALFVAGPAVVADQPKPNALTPQEIADGWLLLFDGETTFGWTVDGTVAVKDGCLALGSGPDSGGVRTAFHFPKNFELVIEIAPGGKGCDVSVHQLMKDGTDFWYGDRVESGKTYVCRHQTDGTEVTLSSEYPDGTRVGKLARPDKHPAPVAIGLESRGEVKIRSIKFRPLGLKPLFNGKNLDGWKVFDGDPKRAATKFAVTADGELSAKNGPGDLQTEKQYDNFVLQLECKTNGKWLNSGVFFRCLPGQYQQGYEAQIHNGYLADRTKPLDYGTGAVYRRVPARKVVSNDNEWFTMTVVANGPHLATWVNGYQTVDWTDDRKAAENARQGLKTGKGNLSLQGHDPTTDLLFRNIRIVELPAKAE